MITNIEQNELCLPITNDTSMSILKAEQLFHYNKTCNFWYATDGKGQILGSIGLEVHNSQYGEITKFFVISERRESGVADKLIQPLIKAAKKHGLVCIMADVADRPIANYIITRQVRLQRRG
jgi:N-acetylglutamate synthase-like GNAT family acetyltransferase